MDYSNRIGNKVQIGANPTIGLFVTIGVEYNDILTIIGDNAHIRSHSVIYGGSKIGSNFQTGHATLIREHAMFGNDVSVGSHTVIEHHVRIGNRVRIHSNTFIPEFTVIEDDCWIGPNVVFTNARYPKSRNVKKELKGVIVKSKAKIGANVTILPGVIIGANSLVGAGSVVTKDVAEGSVIAGNPAILINLIDHLPYD
jgi:acetyltransferase-like isoleucine patch superfamily enzyme